jgi:hypothetical protein
VPEHAAELLQLLEGGRNGPPRNLGAAFNVLLLHPSCNPPAYAPLPAAFLAVGGPAAWSRGGRRAPREAGAS